MHYFVGPAICPLSISLAIRSASANPTKTTHLFGKYLRMLGTGVAIFGFCSGSKTSFSLLLRDLARIELGRIQVLGRFWESRSAAKKPSFSGECCKFLEKSDQKKNRIKVPKTTLPLVSISFQLASNKYTCYIISHGQNVQQPIHPLLQHQLAPHPRSRC